MTIVCVLPMELSGSISMSKCERTSWELQM